MANVKTRDLIQKLASIFGSEENFKLRLKPIKDDGAVLS